MAAPWSSGGGEVASLPQCGVASHRCLMSPSCRNNSAACLVARERLLIRALLVNITAPPYPAGDHSMERMKASDFPKEVLKLFDGYVHGGLSRRDFLDRAAKSAGGGFSAAAMLEALSPNFAWAQQVAKDDKRIRAEYLTYPSPEGSGTMKGYFA